MTYLSKSFVLANCVARSYGRISMIQLRNVNMKILQAKPPVPESYDDKNMRLNRPLSPHLTIYKPQLTAMLSITHRMAGVALSVYALALAIASVIPGDFSHLVESIRNLELPAAFIFSSKLILAFPYAFHMCNGIRHLIWDLGKALTIKQVYRTGYIMVLSACLLTLLFASV